MKILHYVAIKKDESQLTNAITWLINNHHDNLIMNPIEENDKYFIIKQSNVPTDYFPVEKKQINEEYDIYLVYFDNKII